MSHSEAIEIIQSGGSHVRLHVCRKLNEPHLLTRENYYNKYNYKAP